MTEIWKEVPGFNGDYYVSTCGRVLSCKEYRGEQYRIMSLCSAGSGYSAVYLQKAGKSHLRYVHRLVAEAFIPNPNKYPCVNHKDEVKKNNNVENLEWCTYKYNSNYGTALQRLRIIRGTPVAQIKNGKIVKIWQSVAEIGRNGYDRTIVGLCCVGKNRYGDGITYRGYQWRHLADIKAD